MKINEGGVTTTANNSTSPNNTMTADKIFATNGGVGRHFVIGSNISFTAGQAYTFSIYAKAAEHSSFQLTANNAAFTSNIFANYNLTTGTIGTTGGSIISASIHPVRNGWFRAELIAIPDVSVTASIVIGLNNNDPNSTRLPSFTGDGLSGIYVWGAQAEQATFSTSYIPTTAATVTRAQESLSLSTSGWFNNIEGQMFAEFIPNATFSSYPQIGLFGDGSSNNFIAYTLFPSNNLFFEWKEAASSLYFLNALTAAQNVATKFAGAYKTSNSAIVKNGGTPVSSSVALSVLPINLFSIGSNIARGGTDGRYSGTISKIKYYPIRTSNSQLQLLTQ